jgi:hypothetical protein
MLYDPCWHAQISTACCGAAHLAAQRVELVEQLGLLARQRRALALGLSAA